MINSSFDKPDGIGFKIEIVIIDSGSSDNTIKIAESCNVKHFVRHERTLGLASAFRSGIAYCLRHGADIIVNTDGDNQYEGECIKDLVKPIINKKYDIFKAYLQTNLKNF